MKKQNGIKRLTLHKETLRALIPTDLERAQGAFRPVQGTESETCVRYFTGYPCEPIYCV